MDSYCSEEPGSDAACISTPPGRVHQVFNTLERGTWGRGAGAQALLPAKGSLFDVLPIATEEGLKVPLP